mgnify:CR=1 FL=1
MFNVINATRTKFERTEDAKTIERIDRYLASLDERFANLNKDATMRLRLIDDNIRRAYDAKKGLISIAEDLHNTFYTIADLQAAIAFERTQIKITEDEVLNEINTLHNFMNYTRLKAIKDAKTTLKGLAKTYGSDIIREAFLARYNNEEVATNYFGEDKVVDVNIRRLRMKIEDVPSNPVNLPTVWGMGYKWNTNG